MGEPNVDIDLLAEITSRLDLREPNAAAVESVANVVSHHFDVQGRGTPYECIVDSATGVGKTYVMAGLIEYFAGRDPAARNFLLLAPGRTIRDKSIQNFTPGHRKSLTAAMKSRPVVITADNFKSAAVMTAMEDDTKTKLFIFTVQALTSATGDGRETHEFQETLDGSLYGWLAKRDDLVVLADEHHCYRGPAFSQTIKDMNPAVVLGVTATPDKRDEDLVVYRYPLSRAIADKFVKTPVLVARKDDRRDDHTKLLDGVTLLKYKEQVAHAYCEENDLPLVNPVMLVIAKDTTEADAFRDILDSEAFDGGAWVNKTLLVHSNLSGEEKEKALAALEAVEDPDSPIRIIISVGMLKEGWDVKNVYVIASMRANVSEVLTEQTLGRGMRLPFGEYTGIQMLDTVEVLAHERYEELLKKREALNERFIDHAVWVEAHTTPSGGTVIEKHSTDPVPAPVFTPPNGGEGATAAAGENAHGESVPQGGGTPVKDYDDVAAAAAAEADKTKNQTQVHEPLPAKPSITLPYVEHIPKPVVVSLNQIDDKSDFTKLGEGLAVEAEEEYKRTLLKAKDGKITGVAAEDHVKAGRLDIPMDDLRNALIDAVLSSPGVERRVSEINAAASIADTVIKAMGKEAEARLSSYLETAKRRVRQLSTSKLKAIENDGITFDDDVKLEPLSKPRKTTKFHQHQQVENFEKTTAYNGWKKNLYAYAWFDSSPEYATAKAIDAADSVVVWARLHINDIPITWTTKGQTYNPDLVVVEEIDGERVHWLVEVKMNREITSEEVTAKRKDDITWSNTVTNSGKVHGPWRYLLLSEDDVKDSFGKWEQMKVLHSG